MGEEEECLILGYKECRMFILSAWKPKVEEEHLNFNSSNDKFGLEFLCRFQSISITSSASSTISGGFGIESSSCHP
ncbi:hypothetical protein V6Z11_1Z106700 [Gossypium hirsutum]